MRANHWLVPPLSLEKYRYQAAYKLLFILAMVDGEINPSEVRVLLEFVRARFGDITLAEAGTMAEALMGLPRDMAIEEFVGALLRFQAASTEAEREQLIAFALQVVAADGQIVRNESALIRTLERAWGIDTARY